MKTQLIVALDFSKKNEALALVDKIDPKSCILKVGSEMFTLLGVKFIRDLVSRGFKVFLDLKFHDIPNTVAKACVSAAELGVWMINVHASGGLKMMQAAQDALCSFGQQKPLLIAVTVLTSMDAAELPTIGISSSIEQQVSRLAQLANDAFLDGVVCSAHEVAMIKSQCGSAFITVTPGIRLPGDASNDQVRIMTPMEASRLGSDYIVVGRSITQAKDPANVIQMILANCSAV